MRCFSMSTFSGDGVLKKIVYAIYLCAAFYIIILASAAFGLHSYPETTFQLIGLVITFFALFGTVNNVLVGGE